jgi:hypothetical protein
VIGRRQLPVASPISLFALARGAVDAARANAVTHARARAHVAQTLGASNVLLTDSGTSALVLALRLAAPAGGTIGLPAYACVDLGAAARGAGVRVRLYDVDPRTLGPDLESLRRMLTRGVDAVVAAHLFGYPADVPAVRALAEPFGVRVIEDAAQGAGGTLRGTRLGSLAELSVLSFGRGKGLCAGGGGALVALEERWRAAMDEIRVDASGAGWNGLVATGVQWALGRPSLYALPSMLPWLHLGEMVYHPATEPRAMSAASASLVPTAFALEAPEVAIRRARARELEQLALRGDALATPLAVDGSEPGFLRFAVRDVGGQRHAAPALGIGCPYPKPWVEVADLSSLLMAGEPDMPGARDLARSLYTLPTHRFVSRSDVAALERWMRSARG